MAAEAGYLGQVFIDAGTNPPVAALELVESVQVGTDRELIDITSVHQTSVGGEAFILGKFQGNRCVIKCKRDIAATQQSEIFNDFLTGDGLVYVKILPNPSAAAGSKGIGFKGMLFSCPTEFSKDGASTITFNIAVQDKVVLDNGTIPT